MAGNVVWYKLRAMETIVLELKNPAKRAFLLALLSELDFVSVKSDESEPKMARDEHEPHSFFASAGLWAGRDIDAESLRAAAWRR